MASVPTLARPTRFPTLGLALLTCMSLAAFAPAGAGTGDPIVGCPDGEGTGGPAGPKVCVTVERIVPVLDIVPAKPARGTPVHYNAYLATLDVTIDGRTDSLPFVWLGIEGANSPDFLNRTVPPATIGYTQTYQLCQARSCSFEPHGASLDDPLAVLWQARITVYVNDIRVFSTERGYDIELDPAFGTSVGDIPTVDEISDFGDRAA